MQLCEAFWLEQVHEVYRRGKAAPVVDEICDKYGLGRNTVYKQLRVNGWKSNRARRSDAFELSDDMRMHVERIAHIYHRKGREHGKESRTPLERCVQLYVESFPVEMRPELPSVSTVYKYFRRLGISRKDAVTPTPKNDMRPLFSNHVHQYDTSVCRYYLDRDNGIKHMPRAQFNRNKLKNYTGKRMLIRHLMIDHLSGAFYVEYSTTQQTLDVADFFYRAWAPKDDDQYIFHGIPRQLWTDNDSVLRSYAVRRLMEYLEVEYPPVTPHHAWVKGVVEQMHLNWERWFESGFLFQKSGDIDEINRWAYDYAIRFQKERVHTRHKMTRFQAWDHAIKEALREVPGYYKFMQLLHRKPEVRTVRSNGSFSYKGKAYKLDGIYSTKVDVIEHPYLYEVSGALTVQYPSSSLNIENIDKRKIQTLTVVPVEEDTYGIPKSGVVPGTYKSKKKTDSEKNFDKVKAAELETEVKPFGRNAERVAAIQFLNRVGNVIKTGADVEFKAIEYNPIRAKKELASRLGRALTQAESDTISTRFENKISSKQIDELEAEFRRASLQEKSKEA